jgi:hypothetical protein
VDHLAAALAYASAGIHVFPLAPRSKVPLIPARNGGRGLHDATTNDVIIRAWWDATPRANIGLRTGIGFDVIDLDGEAAVDALEEARAGREPLRGPVVATGHGFHWYLKATGLGNRAGILPDVDFRGQGGYVVAPPSLHPDGTGTAGSTHSTRSSHRRRIGSSISWLKSVVWHHRGMNYSDRGPTELARCAESCSAYLWPRKGRATTS